MTHLEICLVLSQFNLIMGTYCGGHFHTQFSFLQTMQ
jgi:hypothetical protein